MSSPPHDVREPPGLRHPWWMVGGLGIAQIVSWGSLFYAIGVLAPAMAADLGLSRSAVFGAYSLGMLMSGVVAPAIGRAIDRDGGRRWLAIGSLVAALALIWLAAARSGVEFFAAWLLAGLAMAMTLYDPGFATLAQHFGARYRTAVTVLTLYGGLASTVFWPLSLYGLEHFGWRITLAAFAVIEVAVCLPLHLWFIPREATRSGPAETSSTSAASPPPRGDIRLAALSGAFALNGFIAGALAAHMPGMLGAAGLTAAQAVWAGALIGPMQVAGRLLEMGWGRRFRAASVGLAALSLLVVALLLLGFVMFFPELHLAFMFAALYGIANGVITIARGTVPAEMFGRAGYGALLGRIARPAFVARAIAPVAFALAVVPLAPWGAVAGLLLLAVLSLLAFAISLRRPRRPRA